MSGDLAKMPNRDDENIHPTVWLIVDALTEWRESQERFWPELIRLSERVAVLEAQSQRQLH